MPTPLENLVARVEHVFALGKERAYVEVGRYKGCQVNTVKALARRGYRVEPIPRGAAYYVYPKTGV